jgi:site-specific DNA-cytosine methylase
VDIHIAIDNDEVAIKIFRDNFPNATCLLSSVDAVAMWLANESESTDELGFSRDVSGGVKHLEDLPPTVKSKLRKALREALVLIGGPPCQVGHPSAYCGALPCVYIT